MRNGKYAARRSSGTKVFSLMLAVLLLVGCSVGATLAWLTATTNEVENTFTVGKVNITLQEHKYVETSNTLNQNQPVNANSYKLIPGKNMPKDPFVTVASGSEKCWLFVRIDEANNTAEGVDQIVHYTAAEGWSNLRLEGYDSGIVFYCRIVDTGEMGNPIYVLGSAASCTTHTNGCVSIDGEVTSSTTTTPVLKFTAAAIQYDGLEVPVDYDDPDVDLGGSEYNVYVMKAFNNLPTAFKSTTNLNATVPPAPAT